MAGHPKVVTLKDKSRITIRRMVDGDLDSLLRFYRSIPESDRMFLRIDVTNPRNVERRFGHLNYDYVYPLLALDEDRIIAIATLFRAEFGWKRNVGEIRVLISRPYQRKGLATVFLRELFFRALQAGIHKLQAEMVDNQASAIAAFERLGFRKEATLRKHVTDLRGKRDNLVIMTLDIEDYWHLIEDHVENLDIRIHNV